MATEPVQFAEALGISKTVYSLVYPETSKVIDDLWAHERNALHSMYVRPASKRQDAMHGPLFDTWLRWSKSVVRMADVFPYRYPTNGSSEAIRDVIADFGSNVLTRDGAIHIFDGEYEGYEAYAKAYGVRVVKHDRDAYYSTIRSIRSGDMFFLSQPSAVDGNVWDGFDEFLWNLKIVCPDVRVMLDLCYVGCVAKPFTVDVTSPLIDTVFFSLSKAFGVYYHRIGGCFSRREYPGLYGNMWFKNLFSINLGIRLMEGSDVHCLPTRYEHVQDECIEYANTHLGTKMMKSDVVLLGYEPYDSHVELYRDIASFLRRANTVRYCLQPMMENRITPGAYR